jgi:PAS domain S-box-containing protein
MPNFVPLRPIFTKVLIMTMADEFDSMPVEQALASGKSQRVGWYRFYFGDERWEWSPAVEIIHGYEPGTAEPTTQLVLSHKHPDDYEHIAATIENIRVSHKPFSTHHRIVTVQGGTREVVVIGERLDDDNGEVIGTQGFYIDVTPVVRTRQEIISEAVAEIAENRAPIEQAKGVLMYVYQVEADAAFDLLKWRSQETNVKLRALAEQLLADVRTVQRDEDSVPSRTDFDRLLLTAHERARA